MLPPLSAQASNGTKQSQGMLLSSRRCCKQSRKFSADSEQPSEATMIGQAVRASSASPRESR